MTIEITSTITSVSDICDDVRLIAFSVPADLQSFSVGSHIDVEVEINGHKHIRSYSLIGNGSASPTRRIAVRRVKMSRGGSAFMCGLKVGDALHMSRPKSQFPLSSGKAKRLLVAGGIGITPILGMAESLMARGAEFALHYAGRSRSSMPFLDNLDTALGSKLRVMAEDEGAVIDFVALLRELPDDGEMYVCGPIGMLNAARSAWETANRDASRLRFETFGSSGVYQKQTFHVRVPRLDVEFDVSPDTTLLEMLEHVGADPLFNCRKGECGLCAVSILESTGVVDHRDVFYSERQKQKNNVMCSCVSRVAGGGLIIDLP